MILDIWKFIYLHCGGDEIKRFSQLRTLLKRVVVNRTWNGFEPMTSSIPVQRSTNWANKPTGIWTMNWVQINIQVNDDFRYMKIHIFALYIYSLPPCTCMSVFLLFVGNYNCYWSFWQKISSHGSLQLSLYSKLQFPFVRSDLTPTLHR